MSEQELTSKRVIGESVDGASRRYISWFVFDCDLKISFFSIFLSQPFDIQFVDVLFDLTLTFNVDLTLIVIYLYPGYVIVFQ